MTIGIGPEGSLLERVIGAIVQTITRTSSGDTPDSARNHEYFCVFRFLCPPNSRIFQKVSFLWRNKHHTLHRCLVFTPSGRHYPKTRERGVRHRREGDTVGNGGVLPEGTSRPLPGGLGVLFPRVYHIWTNPKRFVVLFNNTAHTVLGRYRRALNFAESSEIH